MEIAAFRVILSVLLGLGLISQIPPLERRNEANTAVVEVPATLPPLVTHPAPPTTTEYLQTTVQNCDDVARIALREGWPAEELAHVVKVSWRESRCIPGVVNMDDPGAYGSIGLMQINSAAWCLPSKYWPTGYLQAHGIIKHCDDLYHPTLNLRAALVIWRYGMDRYGYGWGPWTTAYDIGK